MHKFNEENLYSLISLHGYSGMLNYVKNQKKIQFQCFNDEKYKLLKYVEHVVWKEIF